MLCTLPCVSGLNDTANLTRSANAPNISAGIFSPPYAINNGNEQLALNTRTMPVTASHYDGAPSLELALYLLLRTHRCRKHLSAEPRSITL